MAFTPINLPIQEILESDFIVDLRLINNANFLLLKNKIEELINNLEIEVFSGSIGTDNPISFIKTNSLIMQDTGFIFQTNGPLQQIISKLYKNSLDESIFDIDYINVNKKISVDELLANDITVNNLLVNGESKFNLPVEFKNQVSQSREVVTCLLEKDTSNPTVAKTRITLTNTSRQNILLKIIAESNTGPTQVFNPLTSDFSTINTFEIYLDFDDTNPPSPNSKFNIIIVDVRANDFAQTLLSDSISPTYSQGLITVNNIELLIKPGINNNTNTNIILDYDLYSISNKLGISPPDTIKPYSSKVSLFYIIDENNNDRLLIDNLTNMKIF